MSCVPTGRKVLRKDSSSFLALDFIERAGGKVKRSELNAILRAKHQSKNGVRESIDILVLDGMIEVNVVLLTEKGREILHHSQEAAGVR